MTTSLSKLLLTALFPCLIPASASAAAASPERPNVILIMTDDQGYGDLSCHGNPITKTPNIDRLHAGSVRLTDLHVSSFCTPTRAALMTGRHPGRTGAYRTSSGRTLMHTDERTVANLFSDNGYATGMVGKWHLGDNAPSPAAGPRLSRCCLASLRRRGPGLRPLGQRLFRRHLRTQREVRKVCRLLHGCPVRRVDTLHQEEP